MSETRLDFVLDRRRLRRLISESWERRRGQIERDIQRGKIDPSAVSGVEIEVRIMTRS